MGMVILGDRLQYSTKGRESQGISLLLYSAIQAAHFALVIGNKKSRKGRVANRPTQRHSRGQGGSGAEALAATAVPGGSGPLAAPAPRARGVWGRGRGPPATHATTGGITEEWQRTGH